MPSLRNIFFPPPPPPPPPPSFSGNHNNEVSDWNEYCKNGLTAGFALFGTFTALFVFSPPNDKNHGHLYAAYLLVVYIGIILSIFMSLYFMNKLASNVLNWKIKGFFTFLGTILFLSCTIRLNLELQNSYTKYLWFSFIVFVIMIWGYWLNYHRLIRSAQVSDNPSTTTTLYDTPSPPLPDTRLEETLSFITTTRPHPSTLQVPSSPLAMPQEVTDDDEIKEGE